MNMKSFGTDRVEPSPDGTLLLICPISKGWRARRSKTLAGSEFPGTAIRWDGELFEVVDAIAEGADGARYVLARWHLQHTVREVETYDESTEIAREAERRRRLSNVRRRRMSILLSPLLGHLPGSVQTRMESKFGAPATAMTIVSALPLFALGVLGLLEFLVGAFSGGQASFEGWPRLPLLLAVFFVAESAVRLGVAFLQDEPMGSVAGAAIYTLARKWLTRAEAPAGRYASLPGHANPGRRTDENL